MPSPLGSPAPAADRPRRGRRRRRQLVALLVTVGVLVPTAAFAGFQADLINPTNTFASGTLVLNGRTSGGVDCTSSQGDVVTTANVTTDCPGTPLPTGTLTTTPTSGSTVLSQVGNLNPTSAGLTVMSCGVQQAADTVASNAGLAYNGITYGAPGPLGATALAFAGASGTSGAYLGTVTSYTDPGSLSQVAWFKAPTTGYGGNIMGFTSSPTDAAPASWDRQIWIDPTGHLVYGIYPNSIHEARSTGTYTDGTWHMVVASYGPAGQQLWVDGVLVGTNTATTAQNFTGTWHLGTSYSSGTWPDGPTSNYWTGSIAQAAIVPGQLTRAQIATLYAAGTATAYAKAVAALAPTSYWPMTDTGGVPYQGAIPGVPSGPTLVDASGNGNNGTAQGATVVGASGPLGGGAISLDGSAGTYVSTATAYADPGSLSQVAWFKAPATGFGGNIMGFTSTQSDAAPGNWDRQIWIDRTGHLVYGIYPGSTQEVTSTGTYNDGAWHMVVASYGSAGQQLWVDGVRVGSNRTTTAQVFTGYWHLGFSNSTQGWPDGPSSNYWTGSIAQAAIVPGQLTRRQIATLYGAGTTAAYAAIMGGLTPTSYWPLSTATASSGICSYAEATVATQSGATSACAYPAGPGACPAPSPASLLSGVTTLVLPPPVSGSPTTVTVTLSRVATAPTVTAGLHLLPALRFGEARSSWSAAVEYPFANPML